MHTRTDWSVKAINPNAYFFVGLILLLAVIILKVPPSSFFVIFFACFLIALIVYLGISFWRSKKIALFTSLTFSIGLFLYLVSAFSGLNSMIYGALVVALGIYLYR